MDVRVQVDPAPLARLWMLASFGGKRAEWMDLGPASAGSWEVASTCLLLRLCVSVERPE